MPTGIELVTIPGSEFSTTLATQAELDAVELAATTHAADTANPHGVTAAQAGAAATVHTHAPASIILAATDRLVGRDTASGGAGEELTVGGGVEFTGSGGIQRSALTGDVTASAGSASTTIASDAVTTAKILDANVTLAKMANLAADTIIGRANGAGTGVPTALTAAQVRTITGQMLHNVTTTDPTVNDDANDGYSIGSRWVNTTTDRVFTCCDATAAAAVWTCSDLVRTQTVNAASATISPGINHVLVTYASGTCTLTLPTEANAAIGSQILIEKANTSAFGIVVTPDSGSAINGGSTNATVTPSFLAAPSAASTADPATLFLRTGATAWRFM
jgi:hypothetical protein